MALIRRFALRPDQQATIDKDIQEKQAAVPVEEKLAIEIMVPTEEKTTVEVVSETPVEETAAEPIPEKIVTEEPEKEPEPAPAEVKEEAPVEPDEVPAPEPAPEEPEKVEKKPKRTRKTTKKTEPAEEKEEEPEIINVTNDLGKDKEVTDAIQEVVPEYIDTAFDEFKEKLERDLKLARFDAKMDSGMIRVVLQYLNQCFENVMNEYVKVNSWLEQLTHKNYGIITRQIILNSNGSNEIVRKQNGVHAPEIYKTPTGETMNLYALQAALEAEASYLKGQMEVLKLRQSSLIAHLTAQKIEAKLIGD